MPEAAQRVEKDALGEKKVPASKLWGAQTQRSIENFPFAANETMPEEIVKALAIVKQAAAKVNLAHGLIPAEIAEAIAQATSEVLNGQHADNFPLVIWQTGSGTQSNMNMNEVIANRAIQLLGGDLGSKSPVHPNDHVNLSQSSNDVFPTALHIAVSLAVEKKLKPSLRYLIDSFNTKKREFENVIKMGRTHLMDAVPLTVGQEFSAHIAVLEACLEDCDSASSKLRFLAQGGTAVGTGLNCWKGFDVEFAEVVSDITGLKFKTAQNKFMALSSVAPLVAMAGALTTLASSLMKTGNDIRLEASGPRSGLAEFILPANEPGSSIMPGKVNPTQCESLTMVCCQVLGNCQCVSLANTHGHLQLNVFLPLIAHNLLRSIRLLSDGTKSFASRCIADMEVNKKQVASHVSNSLMLVTALTSHIGYDKAAQIALNAHAKDMTLKESAIALNFVKAEDFDKWVDPKQMLTPSAEMK